MNKSDAAILKVLSDLGLRQEPTLTPEQERQLQLAVDPEERYFQQIIDLFNKQPRNN